MEHTHAAATVHRQEPQSQHTQQTPPTFMRLAVVERQLILQQLDCASLARVACTCAQMRAESLHPQCGAFLRDRGALSQLRFIRPRITPAVHASPLFRAHIPVHLHISSAPPAELQAALEASLERLAAFRKIRSIRVPLQGWPESVALRVMGHASAATVQTVHMALARAACPSLAVQRALWSLPSLTRVNLGNSSLSEFDPQSLALARGIRQIEVTLKPRQVRAQLAPLSLCAWPLQSLTMRGFRGMSSRPQVFAASLPHLTQLTLSNSPHISHAQARALFSQLPALVELNLEHSENAILMLGAGDIGQAGLPALRRCAVVSERPPTQAELRRFLWRFPRLDRFVLELSQFSTTEQTLAILRNFSAWGPPVSLDFGQTHARPPPLPQIDDALADIEFDAESKSSDDDDEETDDTDDEEDVEPEEDGAAAAAAPQGEILLP